MKADNEGTEISGLVLDAESASWLSRLLIALVFAGAGLASIAGGYALTRAGHWSFWVITLLVLEPVGIVGLVAAVFVLAPRSTASRWLSGTLPRAKQGLTLLLIAWLGLIGFMLTYAIFEWWRASGR